MEKDAGEKEKKTQTKPHGSIGGRESVYKVINHD